MMKTKKTLLLGINQVIFTCSTLSPQSHFLYKPFGLVSSTQGVLGHYLQRLPNTVQSPWEPFSIVWVWLLFHACASSFLYDFFFSQHHFNHWFCLPVLPLMCRQKRKMQVLVWRTRVCQSALLILYTNCCWNFVYCFLSSIQSLLFWIGVREKSLCGSSRISLYCGNPMNKAPFLSLNPLFLIIFLPWVAHHVNLNCSDGLVE